MATIDKKAIEETILLDSERRIFPRLETVFRNFEEVANDPQNSPVLRDFKDNCKVSIKQWTNGKTPDEEKFVLDTFEKVISDFAKEYLTKNPNMVENFKQLQSQNIFPQVNKQTPAPSVAETKKEDGRIKKTWESIKKAGGALLSSLFSYKPPKLVEDVAIVAEFMLDVLFGGIKGLINEVKPDNKQEQTTTQQQTQEQQQEQIQPLLIKAEEIKKWTPELAMQAVKENGNNLKHIPEKMVTQDLCFAAVANKGEALQFALDKFKNAPLCDHAMKENPKLAFLYVPDSVKTPKMCETAVTADGRNLQHVPKEQISKDLCKTAVQNFGKSLEFVPRILCDKEMCMLAVTQEGTNLKFVPDNLKTKSLCTAAQENSTQNLNEYFPKNGFVAEKCVRSAALQAVNKMPKIETGETSQQQRQQTQLKVA
ncbi:hypothetical protein AGMMS4956_21130 [Bacteroidia bacterium]|nr:hypothetical protein AGMMS4956_21130 [Bacteroidia bacterium]